MFFFIIIIIIFTFRLDPTGRGKGECELLSVPLSHLDIGRDVYPDNDYDYYERDRNAASVNCKQLPSGGYGSSSSGWHDYRGGGYRYGYGGGGYYADRRHDYGGKIGSNSLLYALYNSKSFVSKPILAA